MQVGDQIRDLTTGLTGTVAQHWPEARLIMVDVPDNAKRTNNDGYQCPREYVDVVENFELVDDVVLDQDFV